MAKRKILPGITVEHDEDGVTFHCDDEPIEDMEFAWEDFDDPDLMSEVAEELVEYIDGEESEDIENPIAKVMREIKKLRRQHQSAKSTEEAAEYGLIDSVQMPRKPLAKAVGE